LVPWRLRQILARFRYEPAIQRLEWMSVLSAQGFLNAMNVEFIAAPEAAKYMLTWFGYSMVAKQRDTVLFRQARPLGNAWINFAPHYSGTPDEARDYTPGRKSAPPREVVLEDLLGGGYPPAAPGPPGLPLSEHRESSTAVEYAVALAMPGVLVSSET